MIKGIPAAPGIAIGPIYRCSMKKSKLKKSFKALPMNRSAFMPPSNAPGQLITLHKQMLQAASTSEAAIFEVHLEILDDPDLLDAVLARINKQQSAARAWQATIDARAQAMAS